MHSANDLQTRWPALDVAAKRARLQETFQFAPGDERSLRVGQQAAKHLDLAGREVAGRIPLVRRAAKLLEHLRRDQGIEDAFTPRR